MCRIISCILWKINQENCSCFIHWLKLNDRTLRKLIHFIFLEIWAKSINQSNIFLLRPRSNQSINPTVASWNFSTRNAFDQAINLPGACYSPKLEAHLFIFIPWNLWFFIKNKRSHLEVEIKSVSSSPASSDCSRIWSVLASPVDCSPMTAHWNIRSVIFCQVKTLEKTLKTIHARKKTWRKKWKRNEKRAKATHLAFLDGFFGPFHGDVDLGRQAEIFEEALMRRPELRNDDEILLLFRTAQQQRLPKLLLRVYPLQSSKRIQKTPSMSYKIHIISNFLPECRFSIHSGCLQGQPAESKNIFLEKWFWKFLNLIKRSISICREFFAIFHCTRRITWQFIPREKLKKTWFLRFLGWSKGKVFWPNFKNLKKELFCGTK